MYALRHGHRDDCITHLERYNIHHTENPTLSLTLEMPSSLACDYSVFSIVSHLSGIVPRENDKPPLFYSMLYIYAVYLWVSISLDGFAATAWKLCIFAMTKKKRSRDLMSWFVNGLGGRYTHFFFGTIFFYSEIWLKYCTWNSVLVPRIVEGKAFFFHCMQIDVNIFKAWFLVKIHSTSSKTIYFHFFFEIEAVLYAESSRWLGDTTWRLDLTRSTASISEINFIFFPSD